MNFMVHGVTKIEGLSEFHFHLLVICVSFVKFMFVFLSISSSVVLLFFFFSRLLDIGL